jgi:predicted site-specific integrase-resolvase
MNSGGAGLSTEVAKLLGVKPGTVSAYRHRGQMPAPVRTVGAWTHLWDAATIGGVARNAS